MYNSKVESTIEGRKLNEQESKFKRATSLMPNDIEEDKLKARMFSFK